MSVAKETHIWLVVETYLDSTTPETPLTSIGAYSTEQEARAVLGRRVADMVEKLNLAEDDYDFDGDVLETLKGPDLAMVGIRSVTLGAEPPSVFG